MRPIPLGRGARPLLAPLRYSALFSFSSPSRMCSSVRSESSSNNRSPEEQAFLQALEENKLDPSVYTFKEALDEDSLDDFLEELDDPWMRNPAILPEFGFDEASGTDEKDDHPYSRIQTLSLEELRILSPTAVLIHVGAATDTMVLPQGTVQISLENLTREVALDFCDASDGGVIGVLASGDVTAYQAVRDVGKAARFYNEGLGLPIKILTDRWAELQSGPSTIALKATEGEAYCTTGYSPLLTFTVDDLQATVTRCLSLGANMDGHIQYASQGKVAALRAPDGQMISLIEAIDDD